MPPKAASSENNFPQRSKKPPKNYKNGDQIATNAGLADEKGAILWSPYGITLIDTSQDQSRLHQNHYKTAIFL